MAKRDLKRLIILHVEDDDNDAMLLKMACHRAQLPVELHRVSDGKEAKAYLLGQGDYADRTSHPLPQIVVLDLKLPILDGFQLLKWLRQESKLGALPVLVFTSSLSREDKTRALAEGANSYFVKPASFDELIQIVGLFRNPDSSRLN